MDKRSCGQGKAFAFLLFLFFSSCSSSYFGKGVYGAEEFVLDSYKIREGKFSILEMTGEPTEEFPSTFLEEYQDTIQEGDVLFIALYHPKRKDLMTSMQEIGGKIGFPVLEGKIYLPELGSVPIEGKTLFEAKEEIQAIYQKEIEDAQVFVTYKDRRVRKVELAGLVQASTIPVDGKIRLFDVLAKAKIPPEANLFQSYVLREGKPVAVDLYKLLKKGDMSQNIVMQGGDKIYIAEPSSATLMVMGEVNSPRVLNVPTGFLSLREALAAANGIPYTGDKSYIQVIRGNLMVPKIYTLSWEHVIHLPNDSLLLMPGDVVYVASKPITEWNRFISQLLPSFTGVEVMGRTGKGLGVFIP